MVPEVEVIQDGLVSISWTAFTLSPSTRCEVEVNDPKRIFQSCRLSCKLDWNSIIFKMKTKNPPDSFKVLGVWLNDDFTKHKMKLRGSGYFWTPHWGFPPGWVDAPIGPTTFDILIDLKPDSVVPIKHFPKYVPENLEKLWENKIMSDITFKCGNELIKAHTLILASGSPVLAAMFQHDFKENQERMVLVKDIEANVFENLLHYLYVGNCELLENEEENGVIDLLVAANKYDVESLKKTCGLCLSSSLTVENASQFLVLAHLHNSPELNEATLKFVARNAQVVCFRDDWMYFMKNYPILCFEAVKHIAKCSSFLSESCK